MTMTVVHVRPSALLPAALAMIIAVGYASICRPLWRNTALQYGGAAPANLLAR